MAEWNPETAWKNHNNGGMQIKLGDSPPVEVPVHRSLTITPPKDMTEKELFSFPGVNWLEFFRDSVVEVARLRLKAAYDAVEPLHVEPGNFDQADSIRTFFANVRTDTMRNLETLDGVLSSLKETLTIQAAKYQRLADASLETVEGLGTEFQRATGQLQNFKPLEVSMPDPQTQ